MKKFVQLLAFTLIFNSCIAQTDSLNRLVGQEFLKYHKKTSTAFILQTLGFGSVIIASTNKESEALYFVGGVLSIFGFLIRDQANYHIKKAGLILTNNGIAIPIKKSKKQVVRKF